MTNKDGEPIRLNNNLIWLLGIAFALGGSYFMTTLNFKDIKTVKIDIKNHESRITTVEANYVNIEKNMKSIDTKLDILLGLNPK